MPNQPKERGRAPPRLEDYPHRVTEIVRYADLDPQGHVNNSVFATYFETGRVAMFRLPDLSIGVADATFVLVRSETDFLRELHWPGTVEIGSAVAHFGRSSFIVAQVVCRDGNSIAAGRATMVCIDRTTRRSRPVPEAVVLKLSQWKYRGTQPT